MKLYGIPNCNTVKKARNWLDEHGVKYEFHDFKKQGVSAECIANWLAQKSDQQLINRSGMTWRNLDETTKNSITNQDNAIALMIAKSSVIKRPVLEDNGAIIALGFNEQDYLTLFKHSN
jgi:arsenate reductase (glutaredoxin)